MKKQAQLKQIERRAYHLSKVLMRGESNEYVSENEIIEVEWKENKKKKVNDASSSESIVSFNA